MNKNMELELLKKEIGRRFEEVCALIGKKKEAAAVINCSNDQLTRYTQGATIPFHIVGKACAVTSANINWVYSGKGERNLSTVTDYKVSEPRDSYSVGVNSVDYNLLSTCLGVVDEVVVSADLDMDKEQRSKLTALLYEMETQRKGGDNPILDAGQVLRLVTAKE